MNKTLTILVCIMVAGVVVGASLPIFDSLTASSESVHNEGAGWVRFALDRNAGTTYSLSYTSDDDGFYIDNGTDRQTYDDSSTSDFETILYADSNLSVWIDIDVHILGTNEGNPFYLEDSGDFTIVRDADGVTVTPDGSDPITFGVPTWSYIPVSTGNYGFFLASDLDDELGNGVKNYPSDMPLAVVGGGFAGVYAYNDIYRYNGLGLNMHPVYDDDGLFYGAYWDQTAPVEPESLNPDVFDPSVIDFDPSIIDLDPITLDPGVQLMSVPTPTYTDGDWGYDLTTVSGVQKAVIVSYSGAGGDIVVPATVGGYDVYRFGKDPWNAGNYHNVIDNSSISANSTLTITSAVELGGHCLNGCNKLIEINLPSNIEKIGDYAFSNCSGLTGDLVIPDTVNGIGLGAFNRGGYTGSIPYVDPSINIRYGTGNSLDTGIFYSCQHFTDLVIPEGTTTLYTGQYAWCKGLTGVLVIPDSVTTLWRGVFYNTGYSDVVIPSSITTMYADSSSAANFGSMTNLKNVVIVSDAVPMYGQYLFSSSSHIEEVLDLSDNVDYSTSRYGIPNTATVSDSIGDCFGFISVVDVSGNGGGPTQTLIGMLPLIMVLGLVLMAVGIFIWNRM